MTQKLKKIEITNLKNVDSGVVDFTDNETFINVTGIYGQNGSGKTTLVDALDIVRELILGNRVSENVAGMLNGTTPASILIETEVLGERTIRYVLSLEKYEAKGNQSLLRVKSETISSKTLEKGRRFRQLANYEYGTKDVVTFNPFQQVASNDALQIISDVVEEKQSSFLFSSNFKKILKEATKLSELIDVMGQLGSFAENMRVYTAKYAGLISADILTPVGIHLKDETTEIHGLLPFQLQKNGSFVPKELLGVYKSAIKEMNVLLPEIIPGLQLEVIEREARLGSTGKDEVRLEFIANRGGKRFSLSYESDGIKKIIGIIGFLVEVYNNPDIIVVIDEFDSGIYEYLLGELIEIMATGAKGQLIFTSHNLRVLEVLPTNKVVFSTTNPKNRYIKMKYVKSTNNLRDLYLRAIQLGGQDEELYSGKSPAAIRLALMKAGSYLG